jgi:hypothetical protein
MEILRMLKNVKSAKRFDRPRNAEHFCDNFAGDYLPNSPVFDRWFLTFMKKIKNH